MPSNSNHDILNEPQRRHFEVLLAQLQDSLTTVERLAAHDPPPPGALLARYDDDLPPGFGDAVRPLLTELREHIARLAVRLALRRRSTSRTQSIRALIIAELVRLEDSVSARLGGYGAVDARVAQLIDPELHQLHGILASVLACLAHPPRRDAAAGTGDR